MPETTDLTQRKNQLSDEKRAALERLLKGKRTDAIPRRDLTGPAPLSHVQQRIWFLERLIPGSPVYHMYGAVRLNGALDLGAMQRCLAELTRRHESLRTVFAQTAEGPVQQIMPPGPVDLPLQDLRHLPEYRRETEAVKLAWASADQPFDLERGPLFRAKLFRLSDEEHVLMVTVHHLVADGWSIGVMVRELSLLYEAMTTGKPSPLAPLPIRFSDYVLWQREQTAKFDAQLAWWIERLRGAQPMRQLPTDHPRPNEPLVQGSRQTFVIPKDVVERLRALALGEGATLFMALLAGYKTLLSRYGGQTDVVVGVPVANRERPELEGLIGCFANTIGLRTDLSGELTFRQLLARVRQTTTEAFERQDVPLDRLVEELRPDDGGFTPFFQTLFVLQNSPMPDMLLSSLTVRPLRLPARTSRFDLLLSMTETEEGIAAFFDFITDVFEGPTVTRMIDHLQHILRSATAQPDASIWHLPMLGEEERQAIAAWEEPLPVADAAALNVDDPAAGRLARVLAGAGVTAGTEVGLCMEPSSELPTALLAVLKAGGVVVPLDPTLRSARGVTYVICPESLRSRLPAEGLRFIDPDGPEAPVTATPGPDSPAFLLHPAFTDKVPAQRHTHAKLVRLVRWMAEAYRITPQDRILLNAPLRDPAFIWQVCLPLLTGAKLTLDPKEATVVYRTATGTERVLILPAELYAGALPETRGEIACQWGPTEADLDLTRQPLPYGNDPGRTFLGRPAPGTALAIRDRHGEPVPAGVPGALLLNGSPTGDICRYMPDGTIEWLGRMDGLVRHQGCLVDQASLAQKRTEQEEGALTETQQKVLDLIRSLLKRDEINPDDEFFKVGGNSLLATQLVFRIQEACQVNVPLRSLFAKPTARAMGRAIEGAKTAKAPDKAAAPNLKLEIKLDPAIAPLAPHGPVTAPAKVLLTGATGFIGAFLLEELLQQTEAEVTCLVRARSDDEAAARLDQSLRHYGVTAPRNRIRPIAGDLAKPLLGLTESEFAHLAKATDTIYHNGAAVNFMQTYAELKPTNVGGTHEVLRLAAAGREKAVHHVSTIAVYPSDQPGPIHEDDPATKTAGLRLGYTQSKWVAEQLVKAARSRGLNVTVYRLGRVSGHSRTGALQIHDFLWNMIRVCIELGAAPQIDTLVDMVPVDYVARGIVHLSQRAENQGRHFHFVHPQPWSLGQLAEWMRSYGHKLESVPVGQWRERLLDQAHRDPRSTAARLFPLLGNAAEGEAADQVFDCSNTEKGLTGSGIAIPPIDGELLATYFGYLTESGFLPALTTQ
jgi:thioester reductase-like protein